MAALHCSNCGLHWPVDYQHYSSCPACQKKTRYSIAQPLAASEAKHLAFEAFYADREAAKLNAAIELAR